MVTFYYANFLVGVPYLATALYVSVNPDGQMETGKMQQSNLKTLNDHYKFDVLLVFYWVNH